MRMNRRNVLLGLGTVVAGGGAALGTGAFSSVEADRDVNIGIAADGSSDVPLQITANSSYSDFFDEDSEAIVFDMANLNDHAETKFEGLLDITNNGSENVGVYIPDVSNDNIVFSPDNEEEAIDVTAGDTENGVVDITVKTGDRADEDNPVDDEEITVTINASTSAYSDT